MSVTVMFFHFYLYRYVDNIMKLNCLVGVFMLASCNTLNIVFPYFAGMQIVVAGPIAAGLTFNCVSSNLLLICEENYRIIHTSGGDVS